MASKKKGCCNEYCKQILGWRKVECCTCSKSAVLIYTRASMGMERHDMGFHLLGTRPRETSPRVRRDEGSQNQGCKTKPRDRQQQCQPCLPPVIPSASQLQGTWGCLQSLLPQISEAFPALAPVPPPPTPRCPVRCSFHPLVTGKSCPESQGCSCLPLPEYREQKIHENNFTTV